MIQSTTDTVVHEVEYAHPIELVWEAIADNQAISEWLMQAEGFKPEVGTKFTLTDPNAQGWSGRVDCEVVEADPPKRLAYTWTGAPGLMTTVTFDLESAGAGTRVRLEQSGFDTGGEMGAQFRAGADYGWGQRFLKETLPATIAKLAARG
jgi:uncharacterized protein YndB with AHSA1/START domain